MAKLLLIILNFSKYIFGKQKVTTGEPQRTNIMCSLKSVCKLNVHKLNYIFS
jgi:hypothetical protein